MDISVQISILGVICVVAYFMLAPKMAKVTSNQKDTTSTAGAVVASTTTMENAQLIELLRKELPQHVISTPDGPKFTSKMDIHWAQQARENVPSCIVSPESAEHLSIAIKLIKQEYDQQKKDGKPGSLFAVRSGGFNASPLASSIKNGILIDLSTLKSVTISEQRDTVDIGAGAKWVNVSKVLDAADLAVAGGRNNQVGVGGLTLGGGISFFSPRFGFVSSNVVSYEVVLATGSIVTASATSHPRLWRALKGGLNNFGIVTKFTFKAFPSSNFWSGWITMPPFQPNKTMAAFQEFAGRRVNYDPYAAGPILVFGYFYPLGIKLATCNLTYTKLPDKQKSWPECFANSGFSSLWRIRSTCKVQSLTSMSDEFAAGSPAGKRQLFATVTFKNCLDTMKEAHSIVTEVNADLRRKGAKTWQWVLIFQPIFPDMMRKGQEDCLGLSNEQETLICMSFTITWKDAALDTMLGEASKTAIDQIETMTKRRQTWHRYKYANYCATWQNPFKGYGDDNVQFLRDVSKEVDPDQFFQHGCPGGFKIWDSSIDA